MGLGHFSAGIGDISEVDEASLDFDSDENVSKPFAGWRFNRLPTVQVDRVDFERSVNETSLAAGSDRDSIFGAGVGVTVAERLNLRAEYDVVEIDGLDHPNAVWVTAAWRF